ncbi:MAG TPA: autotransporter outer membrane beta-barrel domain-containing protein [Luteibacter sp.]|jgi:outer membrane autotransporter protein|nr:autotransporter outer membrane beta-barrel domain-containing protein [Luteibacter sp.]
MKRSAVDGKRMGAGSRAHTGFRVSPVARAVRAALGIAATLLVLGGSGAAMAAGSCGVTVANTVSCNGTFTDTLPGGSFTPTVDLTLVLGDSLPTSVIPVFGSVGVDATWGGLIDVTSFADITTTGADGVHVLGSSSVSVTNQGSIATDITGAPGARALDVSTIGNVAIVNTGNIAAQSTAVEDVTTVSGYTSQGDVSVANALTGTIVAQAQDGNAIAVDTLADLGAIAVQNDGTILASSVNGAATGIQSVATAGDIAVNNTGNISAVISAASGNYHQSAGVVATATTGSATVTNSGSIKALDTLAGYGGRAVGIAITGGTATTVTNAGDIQAQGVAAYGILSYVTGPTGTSVVTNTAQGSIEVTGNAAVGIRAGSASGQGTVTNAGSIQANANYCGYFCYSQAVGIRATSITNTGSVVATQSSATAFLGGAVGVYIRSYGGSDSAITNSGSITASAAAYAGSATAVGAEGGTGTLSVDNEGTIVATSSGASALATGMKLSASGPVDVTNAGDIRVDSGLGGTGISMFSVTSGNLLNTGSIEVTGQTSQGIAAYAAGVVDNRGHISVSGTGAAFGIGQSSLGGAVLVTNAGDLTVNSGLQAHGINAYVASGYAGATQGAVIDNSGSIVVNSTVLPNTGYVPNTIGGAAYGANLVDMGGPIAMRNTGSIAVSLYSNSTFANGLGRYQSGATGVLAYGQQSDVGITNAGSISATAEVHGTYFGTRARGVQMTNDFGATDITNSGSITATAISDFRSDGNPTLAEGIFSSNFRGDSAIDNALGGVIVATASAPLYNAAQAMAINAYTGTGTIEITNAGSIGATARSGATSSDGLYGPTIATGVLATNVFGPSTTVGNTGSISANAFADHYGAASATGVSAAVNYGSVLVTNAGAIAATALATSHADAADAALSTAVSVSSSSYTEGATTGFSSSANGVATAVASAETLASANGVSVNGMSVLVDSSGTIGASATADAAMGTALAIGLGVTGVDASVTLGSSSSIVATASGNSGTAIGLLVSSQNAVTVANAGSISASFNGAQGATYGVIVASGGDVAFTNAGHISAAQTDHAVAVELSSPSTTSLVNTGTIAVNAATTGALAVLLGDATNTILNAGDIRGDILSGSGNDTFTNALGATWEVGASSSLGAGADTLSNAGTISLDNAALVLNGTGSRFDNMGVVAVTGNSRIDMGANALTNNGTLDLRNGATGDVLTIAGDLGGAGKLAVDASGIHNASDRLLVQGNIVPGSVTTVNVNLLDLPVSAASSIPVVQVDGNAVPGSFVLGTVSQSPGFMSLAYGDTLSVSADHVFSLGVAVTGLSDLGTLAASVGPGVQSLMNTQVGTLQQRSGAVTQTVKGGFSLWTRVFSDQGTIDPSHGSNNFGQGGNYAFNQKNSGGEVGASFAVTDELRFGVLLDKSEGDQRLEDGGAGISQITGHTYGGFGTWVSPSGFYLDASYRRMNFDARLHSVGGDTWSNGQASTFNLEVGQAWKIGDGFRIEPQLQLTHTGVDSLDRLPGAAAGFRSDGDDSLRGRAGVQLSRTFVVANGSAAWTPSFAVSAVREFDGRNHYSVNDVFFGQTSTRGSSVMAEAGIDGSFGPLAIYAGLNWQDGGALKNLGGGQLGLRYAW